MQNELPHGDWRNTLESGFTEALDNLCPTNGTAYILFRYHDTNTFFPILASPAILNEDRFPYYFFPFTHQKECYNEDGYAFVDASALAVEQLDARCRMELALGLLPGFHQQLDILCSDETGIPTLLLVRSSTSQQPERLVASLATSSWLAKTARAYFQVWSHLHRVKETTFFPSVDAVVKDVAQHLADSNPTPPYFPLLRFKVHFKRGDMEISEQSGHNFLAFNCHLRASIHAEGPEKDAPWVFETPANYNLGKVEWLEDCEEFMNSHSGYNVSSEVQHYIHYTKDLVKVLARTKDGQVLFVARHNKPKDCNIALSEVPKPVVDVDTIAEGCKVLFHVLPDPDDVLVTYWAIPMAMPSTPFHLGAKQGSAAFNLPAGTFGDDEQNRVPAEHFTVTWIALGAKYDSLLKAEIKSLLSDRIAKTPSTILSPQDVLIRITRLKDAVFNDTGYHGPNVFGMFPEDVTPDSNLHEPSRWNKTTQERIRPMAKKLMQQFLQTLHFLPSPPNLNQPDDFKWIAPTLASIQKSRITVPLMLHVCIPNAVIEHVESCPLEGFLLQTKQGSDTTKMQHAALLLSAVKNLQGMDFTFRKEWCVYCDEKSRKHFLSLQFEVCDNCEEDGLATILRPRQIKFFPEPDLGNQRIGEHSASTIEAPKDDAHLSARAQRGRQLARTVEALTQSGAMVSISHDTREDKPIWILEVKIPLTKTDARYLLP